MALALASVAVDLARPWPVKFVVDYTLAGRPLPVQFASASAHLPGSGTTHGLLAWSVATAVVLVVAGVVLSLLVLRLSVLIGQGLVYDLSLDLFYKLQRLSLAYHGRHRVGDLLQRVSGDALVALFAVTQVAIPAVTSLVTLVGMFVIMARLDAAMAFVSMGVVPLVALSLARFSRRINATTDRQYQCQGA